jgi:hypothetical protein
MALFTFTPRLTYTLGLDRDVDRYYIDRLLKEQLKLTQQLFVCMVWDLNKAPPTKDG